MSLEEMPDVVRAAGVSYKNLPIPVREKFSLNTDQIQEIYRRFSVDGGSAPFFILSTCNRTEIYGCGLDAETLERIFCQDNETVLAEFRECGYTLQGYDAARHLHRVCAGLESQIPGDYEVVGQIRTAWKLAMSCGVSHPVLERLIDSSIRASRRVRQETNFSTGSTSVAHVAVLEAVAEADRIGSGRVLVVGAGKISRATVKGLLERLPAENMVVVNRTEQTAREQFASLGVTIRPMDALADELSHADVAIVATGAAEFTIAAEHITRKTPSLIIDLSVPRNVDPSLASENCRILDVDQLSIGVNATIKQRLAEVHKVEALVEECLTDFRTWLDARKLLPFVHALQANFQDLQTRELRHFAKAQPEIDPESLKIFSDRLIEKFSRHFMHRLKSFSGDANAPHEVLSAILDVEGGVRKS